MPTADALAAELEHEAKLTRSLLARVPDDKAGWKPHGKSMSLGRLAMHVATLPQWATDTLKQLAAQRGSGAIAVTGYGDAASDDPDAQSAALALGLSRAKAMAAALASAGVPASAVQVDAAAIGRGGTARLIR